MSFSNDDLEAIDRAIASGALTIRSEDRLVTYRSMAELIASRQIIFLALQKQQLRYTGPRHFNAEFSDE